VNITSRKTVNYFGKGKEKQTAADIKITANSSQLSDL